MPLSDRIVRGVKATFGAQLVRLAAKGTITLLLTRVFLTPDEYGLVFLAISIFSIATLLGTMGIPKSTAKFLAEYREKDETQVRHVVAVSVAVIAVTVGLVCLLFYVSTDAVVAAYDERALQPLLVLGLAYILVKVAHGYLLIAFQGFGRVPLAAATNTVSSVGQLGFVSLFLSLGFGAVGAVGGYVVGYALGVLFGAYFLSGIVREYPRSGPIETGLARRIVEYSLPLTASQGGSLLYKRVDTLMVGFFLTPVAVGFYELAKQVSTFVIAPADSLGFTVAPTFGEHKSGANLDRAARVYERSFEYVLLLYLPAVAGMVLLAEPGITFVFGEAYAGAAPVLQVFSAFVLFQAIDKITNDSLDYLGRATERAIGKGLTGALNFLLNLALIPAVGVVGAAASTAACYGLMVGFNLYLIDRELELRRARLARSVCATCAIAATVGIAVVSLQSYVEGLASLLAVVCVGLLVWGCGSVASGILDVREVRAHL